MFLLFLFHAAVLGQINNPRHPAEWEEVSAILMEADLILSYPSMWEESIDPYIKVAEACIKEKVHLYVIDPDTGGNYSTRFVNLDTIFSNRGLLGCVFNKKSN